jgi:hypothetical protein
VVASNVAGLISTGTKEPVPCVLQTVDLVKKPFIAVQPAASRSFAAVVSSPPDSKLADNSKLEILAEMRRLSDSVKDLREQQLRLSQALRAMHANHIGDEMCSCHGKLAVGTAQQIAPAIRSLAGLVRSAHAQVEAHARESSISPPTVQRTSHSPVLMDIVASNGPNPSLTLQYRQLLSARPPARSCLSPFIHWQLLLEAKPKRGRGRPKKAASAVPTPVSLSAPVRSPVKEAPKEAKASAEAAAKVERKGTKRRRLDGDESQESKDEQQANQGLIDEYSRKIRALRSQFEFSAKAIDHFLVSTDDETEAMTAERMDMTRTLYDRLVGRLRELIVDS